MKIDTKFITMVETLPTRPGVYIFKDAAGLVLYVGKSIHIRDRVKSYFMGASHLGPKTTKLLAQLISIDYVETDSEIEALLVESELIKKHKPEFNSQWKDDKRYKYIYIQNAALRKRKHLPYMLENNVWPWVGTTRQIDNKNDLYFGPFPAGNTVNQVLKTLRRIFPWCKFDSFAKIKSAKKPCFYSHIGLCPGICADQTLLEEYWHSMDQLIVFLSGRKKEVQQHYEKRMQEASQQQQFEKASHYRDVLKKLDYITQRFHAAGEYIENPNLVDDIREDEIKQLSEILGIGPLDQPLDFYIEGYDISNTGATHTTASRVAFVGGQPEKSLYRRYKIQVKDLPDDYAAMHEVLTRRLKKGDDLPHVMLIDGGKGQLSVALHVRETLGLSVPMVGLAKREEVLIVPDVHGVMREVRLPKNSPALQLIQRVRDESHRFARAYHRLLRSKGFLENAKSTK